LTKDGRISVAGLSSGNVGYLAHAMHQVTKWIEITLHSFYLLLYVYVWYAFLFQQLWKMVKDFNI